MTMLVCDHNIVEAQLVGFTVAVRGEGQAQGAGIRYPPLLV